MKYLTLLFATAFVAVSAMAEQVQLSLSTTHPMLPAAQKNTTFIKVALTGFQLKQAERAPVNLSIVLDKSGSMQGDSIVKAREAACQAVSRLQKNDIVSIVAYDSGVQVLVPATKVTDKQSIIDIINKVQADGGTALFAGVSKAAAETRKFFQKNHVNRVILLSDGQANEGPSSPAALGELGSSLIKEGISVSTIGLGQGYNEDLMARLATKSDGNHIYAHTSKQLIAAFNNEFGDVLSVVAQEVSIKIVCDTGVRPIRVLGRDAEITGQNVVLNMNQLYSQQEKFVMLEVEVPAGLKDATRQLASCSVSYSNLKTKVTDKLTSQLAVRFSESQQVVAKNVNQDTMNVCISVHASVANSEAIKLRDQGKIEEAKKILLANDKLLKEQLAINPTEELKKQASYNLYDYQNISNTKDWNVNRKKMKAYNRGNINQQKETQAYDTPKTK